MWSNSPLVLLSVRLGERFRLRLPLGLWAVSGLLLSLDGLLAWVPGTWGGRLRPLSDGAYAFLRELQAQPPQELVNVRLRDKEGPVQVSARTLGPLPAKKEGARPRRGMPWALCLPWELAACWLSLLLVGLLLEQSLGGLLGGGALLFLWRLLPRPVLLALLLLDGAAPLDAEDEAAMAVAEKVPHLLVVVNKSDLPRKLDIGALADRFDNVLSVSAKTGEGMAALCEAIGEQFPTGTETQGELLTNARQADAVGRALHCVQNARASLRIGMTPDVVLTDAEGALEALGELNGKHIREDLVDTIFSRFCVGK